MNTNSLADHVLLIIIVQSSMWAAAPHDDDDDDDTAAAVAKQPTKLIPTLYTHAYLIADLFT